MTPASRLSGEELLDTFLDIVLGDDDLLAAEFDGIVGGLADAQPPETTAVEQAPGNGPTGSSWRRPRRRGDSRRGTAPVSVVGGRGVRSPPARSVPLHPHDR